MLALRNSETYTTVWTTKDIFRNAIVTGATLTSLNFRYEVLRKSLQHILRLQLWTGRGRRSVYKNDKKRILANFLT
jgi:hypothetical protein